MSQVGTRFGNGMRRSIEGTTGFECSVCLFNLCDPDTGACLSCDALPARNTFAKRLRHSSLDKGAQYVAYAAMGEYDDDNEPLDLSADYVPSADDGCVGEPDEPASRRSATGRVNKVSPDWDRTGATPKFTGTKGAVLEITPTHREKMDALLSSNANFQTVSGVAAEDDYCRFLMLSKGLPIGSRGDGNAIKYARYAVYLLVGFPVNSRLKITKWTITPGLEADFSSGSDLLKEGAREAAKRYYTKVAQHISNKGSPYSVDHQVLNFMHGFEHYVSARLAHLELNVADTSGDSASAAVLMEREYPTPVASGAHRFTEAQYDELLSMLAPTDEDASDKDASDKDVAYLADMLQ